VDPTQGKVLHEQISFIDDHKENIHQDVSAIPAGVLQRVFYDL
jgi:hypothetical protein